MSQWTWGYWIWGFRWLLIGFLAFELTAKDVTGVAPWPSLSATVWHADKTYAPYVASALFALLLGLMAHFFYHRPLWQAIAFGLAISVSAHLLDSRLP